MAPASKQDGIMDPQPETSALKVWLQLFALLALIFVLGCGVLWVRRHFH